ncbi:hypothetical protein RHECIAT_CH0003309 [Rhizobium etli CIAT 652]|uniref:Uncharacterized protein n=1 Tax=Rhizobium etli (strain CIAT 652) TaxID=491916 RepID=B3PVN7_RHIE6|nr:hypothetical protein RHECIAT_CH0003309 [Rhizobium etli CIAT 652]
MEQETQSPSTQASNEALQPKLRIRIFPKFLRRSSIHIALNGADFKDNQIFVSEFMLQTRSQRNDDRQ